MVAANGIYKMAVVGTVQGEQHIHTLHFRSTPNPNNTTMSETAYMTAIANAWKAQARVGFLNLFGTVDTPNLLQQLRKVCGSLPLPAGVDLAEGSGSQAGTRVVTSLGDQAAAWLAGTLTHRSGFAGRSYRGRNYLGGLFEADLQQQSVSATYQGLLQAYANGLAAAFITPLEVDAVAKLFVYSRKLASVAGTQCQNAGADVTQLTPSSKLATMKSRRAGHGP